MAKVVRAWAPFFAIVAPAAGVAALGLLQLAGWLVEPAWLVRQEGRPTMVAATAAGMVIAGLGVLAAYRHSAAARRLRLACAALLALLGAAALLQHLAGIPLGIDLPRVHGALDGANGTAGRMAAPTAFCFVLTAILLYAFDRPNDRGRALLVQVLAGALLTLGFVSLIAHDATPEGLLVGLRYSRMAAATALAFIGLGVALLALIARAPWYEAVYARREDEKILVLATGIFTMVVVGTTAAAFVAIQHNLEGAVKGTLAQAVSDRAVILESVFANRVTRAGIVATRPVVVEALERWTVRDDESQRERMHVEAASFLGAGFTSVELQDAAGRTIAAAGSPVGDPPLALAVAGQRAEATLLWKDDFRLRVVMPVRREARLVGWAVTEQDLDLLPRLQREVGELGRTAEWVLCGARDAGMACAPQRFRDRPWTSPRKRDGASLPMDLALDGQRGVGIATDYDGDRVIAGYSPVGATTLGVVLKLSTAEFYAPLREQLAGWGRWFLAMALLGALLVASQVRPVAQRLVLSENLSRARAEALARSEGALRELYASLGDGILVLTPEGVIEFVNPAGEKLFGYPPGKLAGEPVARLIPPELREANAAATRRFLETGSSNVLGRGGLVFPAVRADGSRFELEFSLARMDRGGDTRLVAVLRDVSERRALERLKGEFVATVSHELRTPLTSILGALEILAESESLPPAERSFVEMAARNGERLAALVNDVIDTERIESGAMQFALADFALPAFLADAVSLNQGYAAAHHVFFYLEEPVPEATLHSDRGRLMQVMANLLSNAAKFSPDGEEVRVRGRVLDGRVRVEVSDRGPGIPEEFHARIFTRFAQADASDARDKGGTGLGLAICKGIVERLGGTIGFDSAAGAGTTFWFELPRAAA